MQDLFRTKWAAIGAAVAITLGAGGVSLTQAALTDGDKPVYVSLDEPCRLVDTRPDSQIGPKNTPIAAGDTESYEIQVTGANGNCTGALAIPTDAVGVSTNVTAIQPSGAASGRSYFTIYPADATRPVTSNLNFLNGQPPTPNKVDVGLSDSGKIIIYNNDGTAHAAVDIFGYYIDHGHTGADIVDESLTGADIDDGSLTNADIRDEPGVVTSFNNTPTTLDDPTLTRIASASIRVPADGYVVANATGVFSTNTNANEIALCELHKSGSASGLDIDNRPFASLTDFGASGPHTGSFSTHAVFEVDVTDNPGFISSGQVVGLDCQRFSGTVIADNVRVTLTYYPRSYAPFGIIAVP